MHTFHHGQVGIRETTRVRPSEEAVKPGKETLCCGQRLLSVHILLYRIRIPISLHNSKESVRTEERSVLMLPLLIQWLLPSTTFWKTVLYFKISVKILQPIQPWTQNKRIREKTKSIRLGRTAGHGCSSQLNIPFSNNQKVLHRGILRFFTVYCCAFLGFIVKRPITFINNE